MTRVGVLGPLEALREGERLRLGGLRQQALLATLALGKGRAQSSDMLVDRIWPNSGPVDAQGALHQQVFKLRRVLGSGCVERSGTGYRLALPAGALDLERFERLLSEARNAPPAGAAALLAEARSLWRGPALDGLLHHVWAAEESRRLDERRLEAWQLYAEALLELGALGEAEGELAGLVGAAPLREPAWALLMTVLARQDRQADALEVFRQARRHLVETIGIEPGERLRSLNERILRQEHERPPAGPSTPPAAAPESSLVGRDGDLAALQALMDGGATLVTLTGPAGIGKTSLALELSRRDPGSLFVELAPVTDPARVLPALGAALGVDADPGEPLLDALAAELARSDRLLVLDNFEHLLDAVPAFGELRARTPGLRALVTSRYPLGLEGEHVMEVGPLAPGDGATLFVKRAGEAGWTEPAGQEADRAVVQLCLRLDGLPLAIELAAARLRHLSLSELSARLNRRLELLARDAPGLPERQRSLRGALFSSWELLSEEERTAFARLGVFASGASLEAAEAVCGSDALERISRLIDASLVRRVERHGRSRYLLLESMRAFALERLAERGDEENARALHAAAMLDFAAHVAPFLTDAVRDSEWHARVRDEHDDLVAALTWARERGDGETILRLLAGVRLCWLRSGGRWEGIEWAMTGLGLIDPGDDELRAEALVTAGNLGCDLPTRYGEAETWLREALPLAERLDRPDLTMASLTALSCASARDGRPGDAAVFSKRLLATARKAGDRSHEAIALSDLANAAMQERDWPTAVELARAAIATGAAAPGYAQHNLGLSLVRLGDVESAAPHLAECLRIEREFDDFEGLAYVLVAIAAGTARSDPDGAARLLGAAAHLLERCGTDLQPTEAELQAETLPLLGERLGPGELAAALEAGRALSTSEACEAALDCLSLWGD
jgi:predicted ATPase/DNA-binding SARP family transcriptional activator